MAGPISSNTGNFGTNILSTLKTVAIGYLALTGTGSLPSASARTNVRDGHEANMRQQFGLDTRSMTQATPLDLPATNNNADRGQAVAKLMSQDNAAHSRALLAYDALPTSQGSFNNISGCQFNPNVLSTFGSSITAFNSVFHGPTAVASFANIQTSEFHGTTTLGTSAELDQVDAHSTFELGGFSEARRVETQQPFTTGTSCTVARNNENLVFLGEMTLNPFVDLNNMSQAQLDTFTRLSADGSTRTFLDNLSISSSGGVLTINRVGTAPSPTAAPVNTSAPTRAPITASPTPSPTQNTVTESPTAPNNTDAPTSTPIASPMATSEPTSPQVTTPSPSTPAPSTMAPTTPAPSTPPTLEPATTSPTAAPSPVGNSSIDQVTLSSIATGADGSQLKRIDTASNALVLADTFGNISVYDTSNPENPTPVNTFNVGTNDAITDIHVDDRFIFMSQGDDISIYDRRTEPPTLLSTIDNESSDFVSSIAIDNTRLWSVHNRATAYDITIPSNPVELAEMPFTGTNIKGFWAEGNTAFYVTNDGVIRDDLFSVDVSNPTEPVVLDRINSSYQDINFAYKNNGYLVVVDPDSAQVIDANDPTNMERIANIPFSKSPTLNPVFGGMVDGSLLYLWQGNQGIKVYDFSDPEEPALLEQFQFDDFDVHLMEQQGNTLYAIDSNRGIKILDRNAFQALAAGQPMPTLPPASTPAPVPTPGQPTAPQNPTTPAPAATPNTSSPTGNDDIETSSPTNAPAATPSTTSGPTSSEAPSNRSESDDEIDEAPVESSAASHQQPGAIAWVSAALVTTYLSMRGT